MNRRPYHRKNWNRISAYPAYSAVAPPPPAMPRGDPNQAMYYSGAEVDTNAGGDYPMEIDAFDRVLQTGDWLIWAFRLLLLVIATVALGLAIWGVVQASKNSKRLDSVEDDDGGLILKRMPEERSDDTHGHALRWDAEQKMWVPGRGQLVDLRDVALGSKHLPLEDGDLLQWQNGKVVNSRDRLLEQELGHHLDTKFRSLRNGHIMIRNQTAGQWRNVPLAALLTLSGLSDVDLRVDAQGKRHIPDGSRLEYNRRRSTWTLRSPLNRAWLRFCPPPDATDPKQVWGHIDPPLTPGRWSPIRPVSSTAGIYLINIFSHGDLRVSRKDASITTPTADHTGTSRPSGGRPYRLRATISATGLPPGALGFLVSSESTPEDGGFFIGPNNTAQQHQWAIESVRQIPDNRRIVLAYQSLTNDTTAATGANALIQCFHMSVEEI